jgi:hypothetical protein
MMPEQEVSINDTYEVKLVSEPANWNDKCFALCKPDNYANNGSFFSDGKKYSQKGLKSFIEQHDPILQFADENVEKVVETALSHFYQKTAKTLDNILNPGA